MVTARTCTPRFLVAYRAEQLIGADVGVSILVCCPPDAPADSQIVVESMRAYGHDLSHWSFPLVFCVGPRKGVSAPGLIPGYGADYQTLCVTDDALLYVPAGKGACVFDPGLHPLGEVRNGNLPLQAAAYDDYSDTLILSGNDCILALGRPSVQREARTPEAGPPSQPAAAGAAHRDSLARTFQAHSIERWCHKTGTGRFAGGSTHRVGGGGVTLLPELGFVVLARYYMNELAVFRISDGALVSSVALPRPIYIAAGWPAEVYAASESTSAVYAVKFDSAGRASPLRLLFSHPEYAMSSPLAAVPPAPGRLTWHLVIAMYDGTKTTVLALPGGTPVFDGDIGSVCRVIRGLAADPAGRALLVSDIAGEGSGAQGVVRTLCWPLEGMPELV